jgi:hypothetical protein
VLKIRPDSPEGKSEKGGPVPAYTSPRTAGSQPPKGYGR